VLWDLFYTRAKLQIDCFWPGAKVSSTHLSPTTDGCINGDKKKSLGIKDVWYYIRAA